jgi:hypothetical protein
MEGDQGGHQARPLHICCYILYVDVEVADKAHTGERNLSDQGSAPL